MRQNAARATGVTAASAPPATATSTEPSRTIRVPSPTAWAPAAQAVVTERLGPVKPLRMATRAAVALGIIMGTKKGLTRSAPFSRYTRSCASSVCRPPTPVPATTAHRAGSVSRSPASTSASAAAASPSWATRSARRASLVPRYGSGSKPRTSHANFTGCSLVSKPSIEPAVDRPAVSVSQKVSRSVPAGVLTPMPVTTTRVCGVITVSGLRACRAGGRGRCRRC